MMRRKTLAGEQEINQTLKECEEVADNIAGVRNTPQGPQPAKDGSWDAYLQELENKIKDAYESSITITEAEKLAGEFLVAQMKVNAKIRVLALDARMRKQGVKAIRASVYLEKARAVEKKPSDSWLDSEVQRDPLVLTEQKSFDEAETEAEMYQNYLRIFDSCHVYFRQLSKSNG